MLHPAALAASRCLLSINSCSFSTSAFCATATPPLSTARCVCAAPAASAKFVRF
ncbi:unnamed protein product [Ectocarpus sp. CCAP 1310/34]|nr:unnamed protein product [Ectocarpus sp. CCAP 1310/34]